MIRQWCCFIASMLLTGMLMAGPMRAAGVSPTSNIGDITVTGQYRLENTERLHYIGCRPVLCGLSNQKAQELLNTELCKEEQEAFARAKAAAVNVTDTPVEASFGYEVKRNSGGLMSLVFYHTLYTGEQAAETRIKSLTVSTVTGEKLSMNALFSHKEKGRERLDKLIVRQLTERGLDAKLQRAFSGITGEECFYVTEQALVIVLEENEYFPREMGTVEFAVSLDELSLYWKPVG